jgi:hypothetical protein
MLIVVVGGLDRSPSLSEIETMVGDAAMMI